MSRPDYFTHTVADAAAYAAAHADPIDVDYDEEPGCYCYDRYGRLQHDPCRFCEHEWEVEEMYGPIPPEPDHE